jgi:osmotically-inducible protein OsmY
MLKQNHFVKLLICVGLLTAFIGCASTQKHESTGQYIDDSVITTKVKADILGEKSLKVFQIGVKSTNGVVELSGSVDSLQSITRAGEVAAHVSGVTGVRNDLTLK